MSNGISHNIGIKVNVPDTDKTLHVLQASGNNSQEAYLAIPDFELGYEYYVSTYCKKGDICQFAVTPVQNSTRVCLYFNNSTISEKPASCNYSQQQDNLKGNWTQIVCILQEHDVFYFKSNSDLTGTIVSANKSIAVFAGSLVTSSMSNGETKLLIEQLPPTSHWGNEFVVIPSSDKAGDIIKIVTQADNTEVYVSGFSPFIVPERGQAMEKRIDQGLNCTIKASRPVLVLQIFGLTTLIINGSRVFNITIPSGPSMTLVPAVTQWTEESLSDGSLGSSCRTQYATYAAGEGVLINGTPYSILDEQTASAFSVYTVCDNGPSYLDDANWTKSTQVNVF